MDSKTQIRGTRPSFASAGLYGARSVKPERSPATTLESQYDSLTRPLRNKAGVGTAYFSMVLSHWSVCFLPIPARGLDLRGMNRLGVCSERDSLVVSAKVGTHGIATGPCDAAIFASEVLRIG